MTVDKRIKEPPGDTSIIPERENFFSGKIDISISEILDDLNEKGIDPIREEIDAEIIKAITEQANKNKE